MALGDSRYPLARSIPCRAPSSASPRPVKRAWCSSAGRARSPRLSTRRRSWGAAAAAGRCRCYGPGRL